MKHEREAYKDPSKLEARYANYFEVGHNEYEFVIDFGQCYPENGKTQFHTRIITAPTYAKALLETLRESIERYGRHFGQSGEE